MEGGRCCYPECVYRLFPADARLVEMRAEGYVGAPLVDSGGQRLGLICAITRRPLVNPDLAESVLQIFATAAVAELKLAASMDALALAEKRWHSFAAHCNEAILRFAVAQPIPLDLSEDEIIEPAYRYSYVADCNDQAAALFDGSRGAVRFAA